MMNFNEKEALIERLEKGYEVDKILKDAMKSLDGLMMNSNETFRFDLDVILVREGINQVLTQYIDKRLQLIKEARQEG